MQIFQWWRGECNDKQTLGSAKFVLTLLNIMGLLIQNAMAMRRSIVASVFWSAPPLPIGWAPINATQSVICAPKSSLCLLAWCGSFCLWRMDTVLAFTGVICAHWAQITPAHPIFCSDLRMLDLNPALPKCVLIRLSVNRLSANKCSTKCDLWTSALTLDFSQSFFYFMPQPSWLGYFDEDIYLLLYLCVRFKLCNSAVLIRM